MLQGTTSLLLLILFAPALETLAAEGNPHADTTSEGSAACCPAQALPAANILPLAVSSTLDVQHDTFVKLKTVKHLGREVPVYTFRQPYRLNIDMLPFDLVLIDADTVDKKGMMEVPAPPAPAQDSWFPDYAWDHFVLCVGNGAGSPVHLGWRFTRKAAGAGVGPGSFIAMIVRAEEGREVAESSRAAVRGEAIEVAVGVDGNIQEGEETPTPTDLEASLSVGVKAPGWMVALLAMTTVARTGPTGPIV